MNNLISYFGCGNVVIKTKSQFTWSVFIVTKFSDNYEKILPFFSQYKILGVKLKDFNDWCIAAELMNNKAHLTPEGLEEILKIKDRMNKGRIICPPPNTKYRERWCGSLIVIQFSGR